MRIVVAGSSGLIGTPLVASLRRAGHDVVRLVRRPARDADEITWDPAAGTIDGDLEELREHLAWVRTHAAPWVERRLRGTSSGDSVRAKRLTPTPWQPA